jgi:hypothetical protein
MSTRLSGSQTRFGHVRAKAVDSIRDKELDRNEIGESDLLFEKRDKQRMSTHRGIVIDLSSEAKNAFDSMCFSREPFSNEIDKSDLQFDGHQRS